MSVMYAQVDLEVHHAIGELGRLEPVLNDELFREVGVNPPGFQRLRDAVGRFLGVCNFRINRGDAMDMLPPVTLDDGRILGVVMLFDAGIIQAFVTNLEALLKRFAVTGWNRSHAISLASELELYLSDRVGQYLNDVDFGDSLTSEEAEFLGRVRVDASEAFNVLSTEMRLQDQLDSVSEIVQEVKQAAGVVAEGELTKAFNEYGGEEKGQARAFRLGAMGVLAAVLIFSSYAAMNLPTSLGSSLAHLGIALSGLAAFGYLAREASHHRKAARWAAVMSVQLRTLDAYAAGMTDEQKQSLRAQFARRVFAEPVYPLDSQGDLSGDVSPTLQAVMDLVRVARAGN